VIVQLLALLAILAFSKLLVERLKDRLLDELVLSGEISWDEYLNYRRAKGLGLVSVVKLALKYRRRKIIS